METKTCTRCGQPVPPDAPGALCPRCLMALNVNADSADPPGAEPSPSVEELAPHFPQLELIECLGRGGMGVVYKARQPQLERVVALKILAPELVADERFAERFQHEARLLARLNHPNIVTVHDSGEAGGYFYLLMEYVDGVNLRGLQEAGRLSPEEALAIVPPICEALQYAHDHGVVHRDIKPENLLLDQEGRVKIADFGIARIIGHGEAGADRTRPGTRLGTPRYMAPEQQQGSDVDNRADIYSLGVVLYEMLTGELPDDGLTAPSRRVQVDVRLDEVVLRALAEQPDRRYQTAEAFKTVVQTVAQTPPPKATAAKAEPAKGADAASTPRPRWPRVLAGVGAVVLAVLALAGLLIVATPVAVMLFLRPTSHPVEPEAAARQHIEQSAGGSARPMQRMESQATAEALRARERDPIMLVSWALLLPVLLLLILLPFAFWLWMLVDCVAKETSGSEKIVWILLLIFLNVLGAIIYFFVRWLPRRHRGSPGQPAGPRLSKTAVGGALWAVASVFLLLPALFGFRLMHVGGYVPLIVIALGLSGPLGATVLGWVAVSRIRHSNGKLYGFGLALADALVFPLLAAHVAMVILLPVTGAVRLLAIVLLDVGLVLVLWYVLRPKPAEVSA